MSDTERYLKLISCLRGEALGLVDATESYDRAVEILDSRYGNIDAEVQRRIATLDGLVHPKGDYHYIKNLQKMLNTKEWLTGLGRDGVLDKTRLNGYASKLFTRSANLKFHEALLLKKEKLEKMEKSKAESKGLLDRLWRKNIKPADTPRNSLVRASSR